jgi:hypothetical protein
MSKKDCRWWSVLASSGPVKAFQRVFAKFGGGHSHNPTLGSDIYKAPDETLVPSVTSICLFGAHSRKPRDDAGAVPYLDVEAV